MRIDTVLFDMGGTLEHVRYDRRLRLAAAGDLLELLRNEELVLDVTAEKFLAVLEARNAEYKVVCEKTMTEAPAAEIWSKWHLRDFFQPSAMIDRIAERLARFWELRFFQRDCRAETPSVLAQLRQRGFKLGIVSNTSSRTQVFETLESYGIRDFFGSVCLSSVAGIRKPDPAIFHQALAGLGSIAARSAYVGDTLSRDVAGSKRAGFAVAVQIKSFLTGVSDTGLDQKAERPDHLIENLEELIGILDTRGE